MANIVNNLQRALRHHIPLIRFKYGLNHSGASSSTDTSSENKSPNKNVAIVSSTTKSGQKSTPLEFSETPKKYRRRPLTQDEIDLVAIGGLT